MVLGIVVPEGHGLGALVSGQGLLAVLDDLLLPSPFVPASSTTTACTISPHFSLGAETTEHSFTAGCCIDHIFHFLGVNVLAAGDDHVRLAVCHEKYPSSSM